MNNARSILFLVLSSLAAASANADTSFTATNWLAGMPAEGIWSTNGSGQVCLKGNVQVYRVVSADPQIAGRLQVTMEWAYGADGRATLAGRAYSEVGTWDPAGTKFTPTAGLWDLIYRGVGEVDGSSEVYMTGYGIGGAIDDLRIDITASRAAGDRFDQTIPQIASGIIKPSPVAAEVIDDFDDNHLTGWYNSNNGLGQIYETNQQFTVRGYWPGVRSTVIQDCWARGWRNITARTLVDRQTLEHRVDLVRMGENTSQVNIGTTLDTGYLLAFGRGYLGIIKWLPGPSVETRDCWGMAAC